MHFVDLTMRARCDPDVMKMFSGDEGTPPSLLEMNLDRQYLILGIPLESVYEPEEDHTYIIDQLFHLHKL